MAEENYEQNTYSTFSAFLCFELVGGLQTSVCELTILIQSVCENKLEIKSGQE